MAAGAPRLAGPIGASALLHVAVVAALIVFAARPPAALPPVYNVDLIAAPPGRRQIGIVSPSPVPPAPALRTPPPPAHEIVPPAKAPPAKVAPPQPAPAKATPSVAPAKTPPAPAKALPKAGGGPTGGEGADVANVHTEGIDFPYPGYLNNIVRQVALNFMPDNPSQLRAEVAFLIRRDGTVTGFRFITRSGDYAFDLEAQGAVEKAAPSFGQLPEGFPDDVLPVVFSFDPRLIH